jgi:hypothetical protein
MRIASLAAMALALAACSTQPAGPPPVSPVAAQPGLPGDEIRRSVLDANSWFARPRPGRPAEAARAHAELEYLAEVMPTSTRYPGADTNQLMIARREARTALGIAPGAASNDVVRGLRDAATALAANDRAAAIAALPRATFAAGPEETIRRLAAPPRVRSARPALVALGGSMRD